MDAIVDAAAAQFELNDDQRAIQEMAQAFAADRVEPNALAWDRDHHFPADVIRETGPLGLGGTTGDWAYANLGVLVSLAIGFFGILLFGRRVIRRQEER